MANMHRTAQRNAAEDVGDGPLLERFVAQGDQAAFQALLRRHAPLVWSVCRRVLGDEHDAEDAFQATFLILARKAGSLGQPRTIASWLYTVACHVSLRAKAVAGRRREREKNAMKRVEPTASVRESDWSEVQPLLDQELSRLPAKYREPIVLCYLKGKTEEEAAQVLGCALGTVSWRLVRARDLLRGRLVRLGLTLTSGALGALLVANAAQAAVPASVVASTVSMAAAAGAASPKVAALTEGVLNAMGIAKIKLIAASVVAVFGLAGSGVLAHQAWVATERPAAPMVRGEIATKDLLTPASFESLHRLVRVQPGEFRWDEIPWRTSIWHARKKAAAEDKPILHFGTGGAGFNDPLGNC
jgi:RNA polymerase sigma factor (sigma-70 family)